MFVVASQSLYARNDHHWSLIAAGRISRDFHSNRHTFITNLDQTGISPRKAIQFTNQRRWVILLYGKRLRSQ
jgi:hypothetical protein